MKHAWPKLEEMYKDNEMSLIQQILNHITYCIFW